MLANSKHELFAIRVAAGNRIVDSYCAIYPVSRDNAASASASRLMSRPEIRERVSELKARKEKTTLLTLTKKRELLSQFAQADLSRPTSELLPLAQSVKYGETGQVTEIKLPPKIDAIHLDAELAGELETPGQTNIGVLIDANYLKLCRMMLPPLEEPKEPPAEPENYSLEEPGSNNAP